MKAHVSLAILLAVGINACGSNNNDSSRNGDNNNGGGTNQDGNNVGGQSPANFSIKGHVATHSFATMTFTSVPQVTHVMAVNPQASNPHRTVEEVNADGSFSIDVASGSPYVLVFIDSSQVGLNMIVGIFKAEQLDTLAPVATSGSADLGNTTIDANHVATPGVGYAQLLSDLGLSAAAALTLGAVDDVSLRLTNPDIDGDGKIDALTDGENYSIDFHVRTDNVRMGGPSGPYATLSDIVGKYLDPNGANVAYISFNLASIYAMYPASFDGNNYVDQGVPNSTPANGASFTATNADGEPAAQTASSFSGGISGDLSVWGPDYQMDTVQMPGSDGHPATLTWNLSGGKSLTFPNVVTRTKSQFESVGTIVPFLKLTTVDGTDSTHITRFDYQFMKRLSASEWVPATDEEVQLIVNGAAFVGFYLGSKSTPAAFQLPAVSTGSIPWTYDASVKGGATADQIDAATPATICSMALSFDDRLGLRNFAGNIAPVSGTPVCP